MTAPTARRVRGFTLIELLVVVGLVVVLMAIAVPSFTSFISNYHATSAVNEVLQGIILTRGEALKRGRRVVMLPNDASHNPSVTGSWSNGWTVFVDLDNNLVLDGADTLVYRHGDLPASMTVTPPGSWSGPFGNANYVSFDGTGYPRRVDGTQLIGGIVLTDRSGLATSQRTLCIANMGRPRIVVTTPTTPETCAANAG